MLLLWPFNLPTAVNANSTDAVAEVLNLAGNLAAYFGGRALFPGLAYHVIADREEN